jgi:uncharacterized protein (TIGR02266 family)
MSTTPSSWNLFRAIDDVARDPFLRVVLEVAFPSDILHRYFPNGKLGGLTIDGPAPSALGQLVDLTIKVARPAREFNLRGQVSWARHKGSRNLKECYGIDFLAVDESSQRLLAFARQDLDSAATRGGARVVTDLPVRISYHGLARREFLADLSPGGAFVRSGNPLAPGEAVELNFRPPGSLSTITLQARVAWVRPIGAEAGMGLEFVDTDPKLTERLDKLLAKLGGS